MPHCLFCDIIAGQSPASMVYRDGECIAFMDTRPLTPGHLLVVPIKHATHLSDLPPAIGGSLFAAGQKLAAALRGSGLKAEGVNFFLADGNAAGQEVFHVHLHVFPRFLGDGFGLQFPPEYGRHSAREQLEQDATAIRHALAST